MQNRLYSSQRIGRSLLFAFWKQEYCVMDSRIARIIMQGALSLLQTSETWTRGALARGARGRRCDPYSATAQRWCAQGALGRSARELGFDEDEAGYFVGEITVTCTGMSDGLAMINDNEGYKSVISAMQDGLASLGGAVSEPMPASVVAALARLSELGSGPAKAASSGRTRRSRALPECLNPAGAPVQSACGKESGLSVESSGFQKLSTQLSTAPELETV
jgi:hypothetical protein